jgi:adenine-specific DNA-methyltransferase
MAKKKTPSAPSITEVDAFKHTEEKRKHIPTAEDRATLEEEIQKPHKLFYERRNRDLDPQLVWRGKDEQDQQDLVVSAPPLYIQDTKAATL